MISLPSKWLRKFNLDKGDELEIEETGKSIVISLDLSAHKSETEINLSSIKESSVRIAIVNAYRIGFDRIKINFDDASTLAIIRGIIKDHLIGFDIINADKKSCEIENITEPSQEQFNNIFSKMIMNIEELFEIAKKFFERDYIDFEETEIRINQYDNFCRRVISKNHKLPQSMVAFQSSLIHAQREVYHLLRYLKKYRKKADKNDFFLLEKTKNAFKILTEAYYKKDVKKIEQLHSGFSYDWQHSIINKAKNFAIAYHLFVAIRSFYLASSPLVGMIISRSY